MLCDDGTSSQMVEEDVKTIWNEQALRIMILVSLALQIMLSLLGNLRKYDSRTLIRTTLWVVYFLAYAVIPAALGITAQTALEAYSTSRSIPKHHKSSTSELMSFWAPFLLLHLGGPDSINGCYSLEDNEFWLRHLTFVVFQSGAALYILLSSWTGRGSRLPLLSMFVYAAGCIKCFQRVQALRLGSIKHLQEPMLAPAKQLQMLTPIRESMFSPNEQLQETMLGTDDYLMDRVEESQDFIVEIDEENPEPSLPVVHASAKNHSKEVLEAYNLLQTFKRLLVDLVVTNKDRETSASSYFSHLDSALEAFRVVEIELGLAYDQIYTRASVEYTCKGLILHATRVFLLLLVLVGFHFTNDMDNCRATDVAITYLLIAVEISKEIFAVITMLRSDRADLWSNKPSKQRLSNSITQTDLPSVALVEKPSIFPPLQNSFGVDEYLKHLINKQFVDFICKSDPNASCIRYGSFFLQEDGRDTLLWSINEVELDQGILIWHIATALCYYPGVNVDDQFKINRIESKHVSEYLVNLLLISSPEMLPMGTNVIGYHDTCADAMRFFKTEGTITEEARACRKWLEVGCKELLPSIRKGDRSKFVLFDSCKPAFSIKQYVFRSSPFPGNKSSQPTSGNFLQASASSKIVPSVLKKRVASTHLSYWM